MSRRRYAHSNNPGFECAEKVLLLPFGRESFLPAIVERCRGERVEMPPTTDRIAYTLRSTEPEVTLVYPGLGGPAAANALEMVAANGARELVLFGACGGVDAAVEVGDLIVATGGVRGEGTSRYYAPREYPAACDPLLTARLWARVSARDEPKAHLGVVYTTDASYRQGPEIYRDYEGLIVGVECECAAVAVAAARLGLRAGALLFCTDNVTLPRESDQSYRDLSDPRVRRGFEAGLEVALAALGE